MSENDANTSGNASGAGQNDWHEQPTQGPHSQPQYGQGQQGEQTYGQQYSQGQQGGQTYGQQYGSAAPTGQGYQQYGSEQNGQGYQSQGQYSQPYQQADQGYGQQYSQPQYGQANQGYQSQGAYGQPYQQGGQQPYGAQYGQPAGAGFGSPNGQLSSWGKRVGATLIDMLCLVPVWILLLIFVPRYHLDTTTNQTTQTGGSMPVTVILYLIAIAFGVWNMCYKQGKTGQSIGKKVLGIKLISEQTGQPLGFGMAFVRGIAHALDSLPCYIGYLWPLWDAKRQTFADKVMHSVVVDAPKN